jgi:putative oxygen-independent coproporphyrinogen III oxidase
MPSLTAPARSNSSPTPALDPSSEAGFGVYVHWPFCASKCPYCDFNSHVRGGGIDEARFVRGFVREIGHWAGAVPGRVVGSIFFGGGTPSLMSAGAVGAILDAIGAGWRIAPGAEITLEANPSSVESGRFRGYRAAGVNRVSLGVQALEDGALRTLGRLHSVAEARAAIDVARATFERFSFDLIYARAGQTVEAWRSELAQALEIAGRHLSLYQLTIEPGTAYFDLQAKGSLVVPDEDSATDLFELTQTLTEKHGLSAYEVSNHAREGQESRHNLLYWRYGEYAGVGPGAHGRLVIGGTRQALIAERNPERWISRVEAEGRGTADETALSLDEQADEALLMGLRITEGIDLEKLARMTGFAPSAQAIENLAKLGFVTQHGSRLCATPQGMFVLNEVVRQLALSFEPAGTQPPI